MRILFLLIHLDKIFIISLKLITSGPIASISLEYISLEIIKNMSSANSDA